MNGDRVRVVGLMSSDGSTFAFAEPMPSQEPADQLREPLARFFDRAGDGGPVGHRRRVVSGGCWCLRERIHGEDHLLGEANRGGVAWKGSRHHS